MVKPLILLVAFTCLAPQPLLSQAAQSGLAVTPSVGFGTIVNGGRLESGGMSTLLQIEFNQSRLRWGVFGSLRGIGGSCSDGCDFSGQALGAEAAFFLGDVAVGGGMGLIHRSDGWHAQRHAKLSVPVGSFRLQLRLEVSGGNRRVLVPLLLGRPFRVR